MKSVKFEVVRALLASSALGLGLLLATHPVLADDMTDQQFRRGGADAGRHRQYPAADGQRFCRAGERAEGRRGARRRAGKAAAHPRRPCPPTPTAALADKLRDIVTGKQLDRVVARKADREGVEQFYKARDYKPLWVSNGAADDRAKAAIAYLAQVDSRRPRSQRLSGAGFQAAATTPDALAEAEIKFTNSVLTYARQAQIGRIHFSRVGADIEFELIAPEPAKVLAKLAEASDVGAALDSYNPPQPEFKALQGKARRSCARVRRPQPPKKKSRSRPCTSATARSCVRA